MYSVVTLYLSNNKPFPYDTKATMERNLWIQMGTTQSNMADWYRSKEVKFKTKIDVEEQNFIVVNTTIPKEYQY